MSEAPVLSAMPKETMDLHILTATAARLRADIGILLLLIMLAVCPSCHCHGGSHHSWNNASSDPPLSLLNNTSVSILLLNISDRECYTEIINSAVKQAVNELNFLSELKIHLTLGQCESTNGNKCDSEAAQAVFFDKLFELPNEVAIIGPACSSVSNAIAQVSHHYHIPMVSLAPLVPGENNYLFTLLPGLTTLMDAVVGFVEAFPEWRRVAIVSQDEELFRKVGVYLETVFNMKNISVNSSKVISRAVPFHDIEVNNLVTNSDRIVVLNMESKMVRAFLCKAASTIRHQYVWIAPSFYDKWWLRLHEQKCGDRELHSFLIDQGVISISGVPTNTTTSGSALCDDEFHTQFTLPQQLIENETLTDSLWSLAYDSLMSIALGLNSTISTNLSQVLADITARPGLVRTAGSTLSHSIRQTTFNGLSGNVHFNSNTLERSVNAFKLLQFRRGVHEDKAEPVEIGIIDLQQRVCFFEGETRELLWPGGIPSDGSPLTEEKYPLLGLVIATYIFAGCNIITAVFGICFMIAYRKRRLIRLSSPNLNYVVGFGVIVFNSAVFSFVYTPLPESVISVYCVLRPWLLAIGYSLCLGTITTKMWRVYYIFQNPKVTSKKTPLKDWHLVLFVSLFVLIDVIILSFATGFPLSRPRTNIIFSEEHRDGGINEDGIEVEYQVTMCGAKHRLYWIAILFGFKIILHIIAVFLAIKIRKVEIKVLNDSKEVVLILYLTGVVLLAVIITTFGFGSYLNVYSGAYAVGVCLTSAVILGVVFISKVIQLCRDPEGANLFSPSANVNTAATAIATCAETAEVATLQRKVKNLEAQLTVLNESNEYSLDSTSNTYTSDCSTHGQADMVEIKVISDDTN